MKTALAFVCHVLIRILVGSVVTAAGIALAVGVHMLNWRSIWQYGLKQTVFGIAVAALMYFLGCWVFGEVVLSPNRQTQPKGEGE